MKKVGGDWISTTVEITIGYLTNASIVLSIQIYNSRNYYRLLNKKFINQHSRSTTVEITIGYLTYTYYIHTLSYLQQ